MLGFEFCLENLHCLQMNTVKSKAYSQFGFGGGCRGLSLVEWSVHVYKYEDCIYVSEVKLKLSVTGLYVMGGLGWFRVTVEGKRTVQTLHK